MRMKIILLQLLLCFLVYLPSQGQVSKWDTWSTWSPCDVSCDKGIMTRERSCFKTSSSTSLRRNIESCIGSLIDYQFCYPRDCENKDFKLRVSYDDSYRIRAEQCSTFSKQAYNGKNINWKPYMKDHLNLCKLYCLASGQKFYAQLAKEVRNGTPCGKHYSKVCIQGKCQKRPVGCRSLDGPCIVEKRRKVIGVFNSTKLNIGYNLVSTIPKGATDINIEELTNSRSYLALRDHVSGNYSLNGNWRIDLPKTFQSNGIQIHYTRNGNTKRGGETIQSDGPLDRSLDIMLIYQGDPSSHILYSFFVAEKEYDSLKMKPLKNGQHLFYPDIDTKTEQPSNTEQTNEREVETSRKFPAQPNGFKYPQKQPLLKQNGGQRPRSWYGSSWVQFGGRQDNSKQTSGFNTQFGGSQEKQRPSLLNQKIFTPKKFSYPPRYQDGRQYSGPYKQFGGSDQRRPEGQGRPWGNTGVQFGGNDDDRQFYTSEEEGLLIYVWRTAGFTPCTALCAGGIQSGVVRCIRSDTGDTVLDIKCDPKLRPPERRRVCNLQPCPARWVPEEWQACSKTCGEGEQIRDLLCKQVIDRNGEKVTAMLPIVRCPVSLRPEVLQKCFLKPCPVLPKPKWVAGSWGKCSAECNHGLQKRVVKCKDYKNETVDECKLEKKPSSLKSCYLGLCKAAWYSRSYWAKCSKSCGSGLQNRPVICARVDGSALNEVYCNEKRKPRKTQTCNEPSCKGVWMTSEWSQCSADCGSGMQERTVICMKYISGRFQETNDQICSLDNKPVVRKYCSVKKCPPSWFTTEWTKCSVSCGKGVQTRHVSCLSNSGVKVGGCKAWERPPKRQRCHLASCPGQERKAATQPNTSCKDRPLRRIASFCQIVKRHNFCRLPTYKRQCCQTCSP